jgi:succinate dehydrogenase / fumarate reductase, cytochrome b subunit
VKDTRPVNLNLLVFRWPLTAITSFLHRLSGVLIFFGTAALLYLLQLSLRSESGFADAVDLLDGAFVKFAVWFIVAGLLYHLIAGVKHLIMDWGVGETISGGKTGSILVLVTSFVAIAWAGVWIW